MLPDRNLKIQQAKLAQSSRLQRSRHGINEREKENTKIMRKYNDMSKVIMRMKQSDLKLRALGILQNNEHPMRIVELIEKEAPLMDFTNNWMEYFETQEDSMNFKEMLDALNKLEMGSPEKSICPSIMRKNISKNKE